MKILNFALIFAIMVGSVPAEAASRRRAGKKKSKAPATRFELSREQLRDRIQPGDVISISLFPGEEYSRIVTVQPDGKIQMPLIGSHRIAGLTVPELESVLERLYGRYVDKPEVTANVQRFSGRQVAILGEISQPGFYQYRDGMTLLELVSLAKGLEDDARATRVRVLRQRGEIDESFSVNFNAVLRGDLERNPTLVPGDTIHIPKQPFTEGAAWVNRNILPWATIVSLITAVIVSTSR